MNFEILELEDLMWSEYLRSSYIYDFHHTALYHKMDNSYRSVLFVAKDKDDFIAFPLVIRPIESSGLFDATSVYGYCGPITNRKNFLEIKELVRFFRHEFHEYCRTNCIISVFSRLHPLIDQKDFFDEFGEVKNLNKTVVIDLQQSEIDQRKQYRKSNKYEINQLKKRGVVVEEANLKGDIERFIEIYRQTMERVNAAPQYYFSNDYFFKFLNNGAFDSKLLVAKLEGHVIAGAIFTVTGQIMQYHLAGTDEKHIRLTPMKLILDSARLIGNRIGSKFLHLGGGVGGSDQDSLFQFKSGFSNLYCQFSVWKHITDPDMYFRLVGNSRLPEGYNPDYFPLYRLAKPYL